MLSDRELVEVVESIAARLDPAARASIPKTFPADFRRNFGASSLEDLRAGALELVDGWRFPTRFPTIADFRAAYDVARMKQAAARRVEARPARATARADCPTCHGSGETFAEIRMRHFARFVREPYVVETSVPCPDCDPDTYGAALAHWEKRTGGDVAVDLPTKQGGTS